jgi:MFS family permease
VVIERCFSLAGQPSVLTSLSIIVDRPFLLLIPTMCYGGLAQAFIFAAVPPLIVDRSQKFLMFALYGLVGAASSFVFGKLSDLFPRRRLLIFGFGALAHLIIFALFLFVWQAPFDETRMDVFITMVICLSIGDAIFMTQLYPVIANFYGTTRPSDAFASMKVFQSGFTAIGFVQQVYLAFSTQILILIVILFFSLITLIAKQYLVKEPISLKKENDLAEVEMSLTAPPSTI